MAQPYPMKRTRLFLPVALAWLAVAALPAGADVPGVATRLSQGNANHVQTSPGVSGSHVIWTDAATSGQNFDIFLTDLSGQSPLDITSTPSDQEFLPDINANFVVWTHASSTSPGDIALYDITTGTQTTIAAASGATSYFEQPAIRGRYIAFLRVTNQVDVVLYDSRLQTTTPVTNDFAVQAHPRIGDDYVVYEDYSSGHAQVYAWQISTNGPAFALSPDPADQIEPDIDGNLVTYVQTVSGKPQVFVHDLSTHTSTQLTSATSLKVLPRISGSRIVWSDDRGGDLDLYLYDLSTQTEQLLVGGPGDQFLATIDGDHVAYTNNASGFEEVWLFTIGAQVGDFSFSAIAPLTMAAGGSGSNTVTVNPVNGFSAAVNLSVSGQPAGVTAVVSPSSVTPSGGNLASSVLDVSTASFVAPMNFALTVTGASGVLSHTAIANISVTATATSISSSIGDMLNAGCIDNAGIANALTSKLAAAQSAGNAQTAINTLTALKNQIQAQAGKHIHTACTIGGVAFNPVNVLLLDVQGLIDSLRVSMVADPINGYVVDSNGLGLAGATVSILNAANTIVATTSTDITGFYFLATTGVLTPGASYTITVTGLPAGFANVTPPNQAFLWQGSALVFGNFVLN